MTSSTPGEDEGSGKTKEDLIARIFKLDCGQKKLTIEEAREIADELWPHHSHNPDAHPHNPDAEDGEEFVVTSLKWYQEERKLEQSYLSLFLTLWFILCGPLLAASMAALTSSVHGLLRFLIAFLSAVLVTILCYSFVRPIAASIQAQSHRHFQLISLTREFPRYRSWGFDWRMDGPCDPEHLLTFKTVRKAVICVGVASWLLPMIALIALILG
jgi:hypothetical protein